MPAPRLYQPKPVHENGNPDVLRLDEQDQDVMAQMELMDDPWQGQMMIPNQPVRANRKMLKNLPRSEVCWEELPCH